MDWDKLCDDFGNTPLGIASDIQCGRITSAVAAKLIERLCELAHSQAAAELARLRLRAETAEAQVRGVKADNYELLGALAGMLDFAKTYDMGGDWHQGNYQAIKIARALLAKHGADAPER